MLVGMRTVLVVLGAVLELAGIALALREVRERRDAVRAYNSQPAVAFASGSLSVGSGTATATGQTDGPPRTLEQRVAVLEGEAAAVRAAVRTTAAETLAEAEQTAGRTVELARRGLRHDLDGLRRLLLEVTAPSPTAWLSLGLLVVGLGVQTGANWVR